MAPGGTALGRAALDDRMVVELIVPDYVVVRPVVDLPERCADGIIRRIACAVGARSQRSLIAACVHELLAIFVLRAALDRAAEWAAALCRSLAAREHLTVELEHEPPGDRVACAQKGSALQGLLSILSNASCVPDELAVDPYTLGGYGIHHGTPFP